MITIKQVKEIANEVAKTTSYKYVGIRVQESTHGAEIGKIIEHNSNAWNDGEMLEEKLSGLCAVKAGKYQINPIDKFSGYEGDTILVLGSNKAKKGYDEGEIIMTTPIVLEIRSI